jgi:hypothetical protein
MEQKELLKKMMYRIMKKDYPFISEIEVSEDKDMQSYYIDKEKNTIYNVFFKINDWGNFDDWEGFESMGIRIKNSLGLNGRIKFYYLEDGSDDSYYRD